MRTKSARLVIATLALSLVGFAGVTAPAEAAKPSTQRNVWCC
ncbi:hypothetical protein SAMN05192575_101721 [Nocardioides alpinus]|uniref:Uncharacterized protein n=1 Tax=Nocardioides alpinus TaxID=748909 RepID=A0A1I0W771_9ACTN|nr:hypothetical protein [Nocardioides alpinus]SFA83883.1 hypothetical protein SAMN05192575_101720 [Nocardioides alpinus]SFA83893.1 hypothetical protein SAMN05192575_101721 [Nocardioides alpinus]